MFNKKISVMKRNLFLFTLAGIALAGCVNDEMADVASEKE